MTITISLEQLEALDPCAQELKVTKPLFDNGPLNAQQAVDAGATLDHLLWVAGAVAKTNKDVEKQLQLFAADVAEHVLYLYEKDNDDTAPREAIQASRDFANGLITVEELRAADAAYAAADAAYAAAAAAASAYAAAYAAAAADAAYAADAAAYAAAAAATAAAAAAYAAAAAATAATAAAYAAASAATEKQWQLECLTERLMSV